MSNPITPDLIYELVEVGSPALSADGRWLAFTRTETTRATMRPSKQIMVKAPGADRAAPFTRGPDDDTPAWSPDGATLAFLRPDADGTPQVWSMPARGGEARQVSGLPGGVIEFGWAPDSRRLVVGADVPPVLREPQDGGQEPQGDGVARQRDGGAASAPRTLTVSRIRYRYDSVGWRGDTYRRLFVMDADSGEAQQITGGPWDDISPVWSPVGDRIAFISGRRPDADVTAKVEAYVVSADGGEPERWSGDLEAIGGIGWSPDGRRLCAIGTDLRGGHVGPLIYQGRVYVLAAGAAPAALTDTEMAPACAAAPLHRGITLRWTPDDRVVFLASHRGEGFLCEVPAAGGDTRRIAGGGGALSELTVDSAGTAAAAVSSTPLSPSDIWTAEVASGTAFVATDCNRNYFDAHPPAATVKFTMTRGGLEIESRVLLPPGFDEGSEQKYPMVLDVHGGPNSAFLDAFTPHQQVLATAGYVVLAVNPRGSSTYGAHFMMSVLGDWGGEDFLDLMAAVDEVAMRPYVDQARLGIHGYSYGGYMTTWAIGHTDRFRAAVAGAPCTNLSSMYGTSDIGVSFGERHWGGTRPEALSRFLERSPITYAENVQTPLLLMHGETDVRVPMEQSEQYYVSLKRLGKAVEFVRFPDCSHLFRRSGHPALRAEYMERMLGWFDRHLKAERGG